MLARFISIPSTCCWHGQRVAFRLQRPKVLTRCALGCATMIRVCCQRRLAPQLERVKNATRLTRLERAPRCVVYCGGDGGGAYSDGGVGWVRARSSWPGQRFNYLVHLFTAVEGGVPGSRGTRGDDVSAIGRPLEMKVKRQRCRYTLAAGPRPQSCR